MSKKRKIFEVQNITKNFGGTQALKGVSFRLSKGEIVGLIGENGAGKSTLLKIIQGVQPQTSGEMFLHGKVFRPKNPLDANRSGVGMVFQEQNLVTTLSVGQNIFLGREKEFARAGIINWTRLYAQADAVLEEFGLTHINSRKKISNYSFADRQMVEIAKVIHNTRSSGEDGAIILLDEPTSVLNNAECLQLFSHMEKLKEMGMAVVFISHRLDEVMKVSDRICVLKNGENAGEFVTAQVNEDTLYQAMVGKQTNHEYYHIDRQAKGDGEVLLEVQDLEKFGSFQGISFQLRRGQVLGICGVEGSGKEELCDVIIGDAPATGGRIMVKGKEQSFKRPYAALDKGILSVPKWRNAEGIFGILQIADNICASNLNIIKKRWLLSEQKRDQLADTWIQKLSIKCDTAKQMVMALSGGNVQKVVFSRVFSSGADILILNHPTRGVDIGAKEEIYSFIRDITNEGAAVILLSDTLDECIGLSSDILVMKDGYETHRFTAIPDKKPEQNDIVQYML